MPDSNRANGHPNSSSNRWLGIAGFFLFMVILIAFGAFGISFSSALSEWGTSISESDFASNEDRLSFVNQHLPISLPQDSKITSIKYDSWQDWNLESVIETPKTSASEFLAEIRSLNPTGQAIEQNTATFELNTFGQFKGDLVYDKENGNLNLKCFSW